MKPAYIRETIHNNKRRAVCLEMNGYAAAICRPV